MTSVNLKAADAVFSWKGTLRGTDKWDEVVRASAQEASEVSLEPNVFCELLSSENSEQSSSNARPCEVVVRAVGNWRLTSFAAVCDARRVEVYADSDFCGTAKGEMEELAKDENAAETTTAGSVEHRVATFLVVLPGQEQGYAECRLRFVSLNNPQRMRLFCLAFAVEEASGSEKVSVDNQAGINLPSVERWLKKLDTPNNTRAHDLMESVRRFQSNQASATTELQELAQRHGAGIPGLAGLLHLMPQLNQQGSQQNGDSGSAAGSLLNSRMMQELMPVIQAVQDSREKDAAKSVLHGGSASYRHADPAVQPSSSDQDDDCLMDLEKRLKAHIDCRMDTVQRCMEERFDKLEKLIGSCFGALSSVTRHSSQEQLMGGHSTAMLMQSLAGVLQQLQPLNRTELNRTE